MGFSSQVYGVRDSASEYAIFIIVVVLVVYFLTSCLDYLEGTLRFINIIIIYQEQKLYLYRKVFNFVETNDNSFTASAEE